MGRGESWEAYAARSGGTNSALGSASIASSRRGSVTPTARAAVTRSAGLIPGAEVVLRLELKIVVPFDHARKGIVFRTNLEQRERELPFLRTVDEELDAAVVLEPEPPERNVRLLARHDRVFAPVIEPERVGEVAVPPERLPQDGVQVVERLVLADGDGPVYVGIVVERGLEDVRLLGHGSSGILPSCARGRRPRKS